MIGPTYLEDQNLERHRELKDGGTLMEPIARGCELVVQAHTFHRCGVTRLQRIYNFLCSMLVFTPFAYCFITLRGTFMHFLELTY
jgi:hypothetical protein